ncbi:MAG: S41 family peptidase [Pseudomonadota bacterium]|nr:S41 family peptidase [Pseudomonadota bacterium]
MSPDGKQLLVLKPSSNNDQIYVVPAGKKFPSDSKPFRMNVKDWQLRISPEQEWQQLFHDAWLMHRDFFYDKAMRGVDWSQAKAKYAPLLARITDRYELNDVLAQLIGELNVLHSQVYGGDVPDTPDRPKPASLGAMLTQTEQGVVIEHIYQYDTELPANASPLQKPGTNAQNGDIIQAINGREVKDIQAVHNALLNQAGKQVVLTLLRDGESHHTVTYPISNGQAFRLRYQDWVTSNRKKVTAQDDDIGYMHIYAMGSNDVSEFAREFYAANQKGGLIIDVRRNRGGNIDSWLIEKLLRRVWMFWTIGNADPSTNMQQTFRGHLVVLADQYTYSDGETFTAAVKSLELGPVIGKQTAGAGIWLRGLNRLADNGMARVAELPVFDMEGNWVVEGHGVSPNVEVDNLPHATFNGQDAQLEAAVKYLKNQLRKKPVKPLKPKAYPAVDETAKDVK